MEVKCGIDIIEVERIKESIETLGEKFLNRVFTKNEIEYCETKNSMKYQHYAARFAAKEAIFKAISTLLDNKFDVSWQNAEITVDEDGKPSVKFLDVEFNKIQSIDISISHLKEYAISNCVVILKGE